MTGKFRKGKNPGEIDSWLEVMGYYRKNVAYDETCLFRAISEQLFCSQMMHEKVRMDCIEYGRKNPSEFQNLIPSNEAWEEHLNKLAVHMVICGNIEIQLISKTYRHEVLVFDGINFEIKNVTRNNYTDIFQICLVNKDHYDVIYRRDYIMVAGICQSIVYGILYENVFGVENVNNTVNHMLYGKPLHSSSSFECSEKNGGSVDKTCVSYDMKDFVNSLILESCYESPVSPSYTTGTAPFPYKVAKALDPSIYRNIAYDTWTEMRREMRLGEWYQGDDKLILGTCCELITENNYIQRCYIQEFIRGNEECIVYIPSLAERRIVKYKDLSPEANAKPWPLPYRFAKTTTSPQSPASQPFILPADRRNFRRNRDKKTCKTESIIETELLEHELNAFEGCPLHMQMSQEVVNSSECQEITITTPSSLTKPQVFSPSDISISSPYSYSYTSSFSFTTQQAEYSTMPTPPTSSPELQPAAAPLEPPPTTFYPAYLDLDRHPINVTAASPSVPQVEMYPMYPMPGTPIIYSPSEAPEIILPPSAPHPHVQVYTPTVDVQYMPTSPYMFPPTPPPWYPPGVNSQGFIFPTPYNGVNHY